MKSSISLVFGILILFLITCLAYNAIRKSIEKCDDKPSETGPCKAYFPMWRFIKKTRQCESFIYGGCKCTKNLFEDEEECKAHCLT